MNSEQSTVNKIISVVIPVVNEVQCLPNTLQNALQGRSVEVIVVDGDSEDETVLEAKKWGVQVISTTRGRSHQMNAGAKIARGEILLFLHGDTLLPPNYDQLVREVLHPPEVIAGAFELGIQASGWGFRMIEKMVQVRSHFCSLPYGDQAIFLSAKTFQQFGGFPDLPIMEDFEMMQQLKRQGTIAIVPQPVLTSPRRWQKFGIFKTTLVNQLIILGYFTGIAPQRLSQWYRGLK